MKDGSEFGGKKGFLRVNDISFEDYSGSGNCSLEVEYTTANIDDIRNNIKSFADRGDYYLYSSLCNGKLVYSKDKKIDNRFLNLKKSIKMAYLDSYGNSRLNEDEALSERISIINALDKIKSSYSEAGFNNSKFLYFNLVEKIRIYYCNLNGYPYIQTYRVDRVYSDESYKKSLFGNIKVADDEFMKLYLRCISEYRSEDEIMEALNNSHFTSADLLSNNFKNKVKNLRTKPKSFNEMLCCITELFDYVTKDMEKINTNGDINYEYTKKISSSWY